MAIVAPMIPPAKRGGRKREVDMREVFNGVLYVLSTGCQWRYLPKDLLPKGTVYRYFCQWGYTRTLERIHHALYVKCRDKLGREASPTGCIIDSQSVKGADLGREERTKGGLASPRIGKISTAVPAVFCVSPRPASCCESFARVKILSGQTLSG